jgi:hypothetical protein
MTATLGCEQWASIQADLYKLLLYEEWCFFRRHRDNERLVWWFSRTSIIRPTLCSEETCESRA